MHPIDVVQYDNICHIQCIFNHVYCYISFIHLCVQFWLILLHLQAMYNTEIEGQLNLTLQICICNQLWQHWLSKEIAMSKSASNNKVNSRTNGSSFPALRFISHWFCEKVKPIENDLQAIMLILHLALKWYGRFISSTLINMLPKRSSCLTSVSVWMTLL